MTSGSPPCTTVAILGGGKGGTTLLDLLSQLPGVQVAGIADKDPTAPALRHARDQGILATDNVLDLITNHGVTLIVNVTGDPGMAGFIGIIWCPAAWAGDPPTLARGRLTRTMLSVVHSCSPFGYST